MIVARTLPTWPKFKRQSRIPCYQSNLWLPRWNEKAIWRPRRSKNVEKIQCKNRLFTHTHSRTNPHTRTLTPPPHSTHPHSHKWGYSFQDLFAYLPIAALLEKRVLCMHGGISPVRASQSAIRPRLPSETLFFSTLTRWTIFATSNDRWARFPCKAWPQI